MAEKTPAPEQPSETEEALSTEDSEEQDAERCQYDGCLRLSELGSYHCIFHMSADEKDEKGLWDMCMDMFYKLVDEGEGDFKGFVLKDVNLNGKVVEQAVVFDLAEFYGQSIFSALGSENLVFKNSASFEKTVFIGRAEFYHTNFLGKTSFSGSLFQGGARFGWTKFKKGTRFEECEFKGEAFFDSANFSQKATFGSVVFDGVAVLSETIFSEEVDFSGSKFNEGGTFQNAKFEKGTDFEWTRFSKGASLEGITFEGDVDFSNAVFNAPASFRMAIFKGEASFYEARFNEKVDFSPCLSKKGISFFKAIFSSSVSFENLKCNDYAVFQEAKFDNEVRFKKANFAGKSNFEEAYFQERVDFKSSHFNLVNFDRSYFGKGGSFDDCVIKEGSFENASIQNVSFHRVNLDNVKFAGAQMEQAYLADAWWDVPLERTRLKKFADLLSVSDPRYVIREELEAEKTPATKREEKVQALLKAESTYRRLKHTHTNEGDYTKSGEFYIHEMRMKRKRYSLEKKTEIRAWWNLFWNWFYNLTCGYGERPKRVVFNALLIIVVFSLFYCSFGAIEKAGEKDHDLSYDDCFYFSVVTFTTLGYGDYSPKDEVFFKIMAGTEAFLGAFTIALFVLVFGRQVMR